jgi:hypothetical protein
VSVCRDVGGIQAQVMSAAELSLWTRRRETKRADVQAALWQRRELVKTTSLRMTLHLIPTNDFFIYIAAMKPSSMASVHRLLARVGASPKHVDTMIATVMDALPDGPKTQQDLLARVKQTAERGMRIWLKSGEAQAAFDALGADLVDVTVDGAPGRLLRRDLAALAESSLNRAPRLLPSFDTFLLAHAAKDHLIDPRFYKRVYRNQGWLSPVVLVAGRIVAVWFLEQRAKAYTLDVRPFGPLDARVRSGLRQEADALAGFLGARCDVQFS